MSELPIKSALKIVEGQMEIARHMLSDKFLSGEDVNFAALSSVQEFTPINLLDPTNPAVKVGSLVLLMNKDVVVYLCDFPPYSQLGIGFHSDCVETIYVLSGEMRDTVIGVKISTGQKIRIDLNEKHNYMSLGNGARIIVIFQKIPQT